MSTQVMLDDGLLEQARQLSPAKTIREVVDWLCANSWTGAAPTVVPAMFPWISPWMRTRNGLRLSACWTSAGCCGLNWARRKSAKPGLRPAD
ncbi:hypothetical protein MishRS11D_28750 [Methylomagnum ishizawai]|nr:hypothetical protein MishRS11D_28750 [Methylomagnum ishizawai]